MTEPGLTRQSLRKRPGAWLSLRILAALAVLALCAELIASPLPWVGRVAGHLYILPDVLTPAALAGASRADLEKRAMPGDFAFGPLVHFGPYDPDLAARWGTARTRRSVDPASLRDRLARPRRVRARALTGTRVELSAACGGGDRAALAWSGAGRAGRVHRRVVRHPGDADHRGAHRGAALAPAGGGAGAGDAVRRSRPCWWRTRPRAGRRWRG